METKQLPPDRIIKSDNRYNKIRDKDKYVRMIIDIILLGDSVIYTVADKGIDFIK
jgi:hypothetical protein